MANLTKKDVQELLSSQTKELTKELKGYTDKKTEELKEYTDKKTDIILRSVANGFKNEHKHMIELISPIKETQISHERKFKKLEEALQIKL